MLSSLFLIITQFFNDWQQTYGKSSKKQNIKTKTGIVLSATSIAVVVFFSLLLISLILQIASSKYINMINCVIN